VTFRRPTLSSPCSARRRACASSDHDCRKPAGARGSYEYGLDYGLVLIRRGGTGVTSMAGARTWDLRTRSSERPFVEQRIAHHRADGDRCTSLWLSESAVYAFAARRIRARRSRSRPPPAIDLRHRELVVELRRGADSFEVDERSRNSWAPWPSALPRDASPPAARRPGPITAGSRSLLASDHRGSGGREPLPSWPGHIGHTRFHLSRVFSQATGITLSQFRKPSSVAIAVDRCRRIRELASCH